MDLLEFELRCSSDVIKHLSTNINILSSVIIFILSIVIFDCYSLYHNATPLLSFLVGTLVVNLLYQMVMLSTYRLDQKMEKERLSRIKQLLDQKTYEDAIKKVEESKKYYDDLIRYMKMASQNANYVYPENKPQESESPEAEK